jgi:hypothetical protein
MSLSREQMMLKRDKKVKSVFRNYGTIWLINDEYRSPKDSFYFNIVYCSPVHNWINEHYQYDVFNNVLYHMGQKRIADQLLLEIQQQDPYIAGDSAASIPNNPANRL